MVATSSQRPLLSPWAFDHSHVSNSTTAILAEMMKVMVVMVIEMMVMEEVPLNKGHAAILPQKMHFACFGGLIRESSMGNGDQ